MCATFPKYIISLFKIIRDDGEIFNKIAFTIVDQGNDFGKRLCRTRRSTSLFGHAHVGIGHTRVLALELAGAVAEREGSLLLLIGSAYCEGGGHGHDGENGGSVEERHDDGWMLLLCVFALLCASACLFVCNDFFFMSIDVIVCAVIIVVAWCFQELQRSTKRFIAGIVSLVHGSCRNSVDACCIYSNSAVHHFFHVFLIKSFLIAQQNN
mmetsp:Transcript_21852/g.62270  ORF Transcript_21852/g.62270 Transcript_21852/m.62270 type:complete len:210 (+) Transcript_21852:342-971(+)